MKNNIKNKNKLILKSELLLKDIEKNANKINKQLLLLNKTLKLNNYYNIQMGGSLEKQTKINDEINNKLNQLEELMNQVTTNSQLIQDKTNTQTELITESNEYLGKTLERMQQTSMESQEVIKQVEQLSEEVDKIKISRLDEDEYNQMEVDLSGEISNLKMEKYDTSGDAYQNIALRFICQSKVNKSKRIIERYHFVNKMISKMISDYFDKDKEWGKTDFKKNYPENIFKMFDCINFLKEQELNKMKEGRSKNAISRWKYSGLSVIIENNKKNKKLDDSQVKIRDEYKDKLLKFLNENKSQIKIFNYVIELINKEDNEINNNDIKNIEVIEKRLENDSSKLLDILKTQQLLDIIEKVSK